MEDGDNPPNPAAAREYEKAVGEDRFHVTSTHPDEDEPLPLVFLMSKNGPVLNSGPSSSSWRRTTQTTAGAASTVRTYGRA